MTEFLGLYLHISIKMYSKFTLKKRKQKVEILGFIDYYTILPDCTLELKLSTVRTTIAHLVHQDETRSNHTHGSAL